MLRTRNAFCAHLGASGLFQTVEPLATEADLDTSERAAVDLPACFVSYPGGSLARKEAATLHVFIPGFSAQVAAATSAADDALGMAQDVADYLKDEHVFYSPREAEEERAWQIDLAEETGGISVRAGRFRDRHAFYVLDVPVREV